MKVEYKDKGSMNIKSSQKKKKHRFIRNGNSDDVTTTIHKRAPPSPPITAVMPQYVLRRIATW